MNPVLDAIYTRRSVRHFTDEPVTRETVLEIIKAGTWAPSGLNNQPWRFALVTDPDLKARFEGLTRYARVIASARVLLPVFIDKTVMYNDVKDHQSIGACIQNMLLAAHSLGLGAVWLGEILRSAEEIRKLLDLSSDLELMAVIAIGHKAGHDERPERKAVDQVIVFDR
ncbi:MAG: nitroreductase [Desulfobacteraceae bacterium]|nr:nitroreductase [Desulfobacteraceae bacterium]